MPDVKEVINGLEMSYKYSNVDENNTLVPQWIVLHAIALLKAQEPVVMAGAELTDAELIDAIRKAPLILKPNVDAAPVVHGRWIERMYKTGDITSLSYFCSECDCEHYFGRANYCPNCGAKMDGERRDGE